MDHPVNLSLLSRAAGALLAAALLAACASAPKAPPGPVETGVRALPPGAEPPPPPDAMPAGFRAAFGANDTRACAIAFYQACAATLSRLRASGIFGPAARAPRLFHCERTPDGVPIGGVFDIDSAFARVQRLALVRLDDARPRHTDRVDTARIARQAHIARDASREIAAAWRKQGRPFFIVPYAPAQGPVEAWVVPYPTRLRSVILGGEVALARAGTGVSRLLDRTAGWRQVPVPAEGPVVLASAEAEVATVADLVVARGLAEQARQVTVTTRAARSSLVPGVDPETGARVVWEHMPGAR
jgi:hypothetical protein